MRIHEGKNLFMDLVVIDLVNKKAFVYGYDGELTLKMPDSMFSTALDKVKKGTLNKSTT